ncbi:MAG: WbqC family protein [Candidatus Staskawiczbacteria bacterium]|nr:WbqC family protein [Candidatus Staskawiczbacteria bacterium]
MTIIIHQPEFLPYIGFFERLSNSDILVILDDVGYQKNGFINRNKIKTEKGAKWITVPVLGRSPNLKINEVLIDNGQKWAESQLGSIKAAYSKAPHFKEYYNFLEQALKQDWKKICDLDIYLIENINKFLDIDLKIIKSSDLKTKGKGTERLINICKELKADEYLSGPGTEKGHGVEKQEIEKHGIKVKIKEFSNPKYNQQFRSQEFLPYMSIIDLLLNEGENSVNILK